MNNNWDVQYSTIAFFESVLNRHSKVAFYERTSDIFFVLTLVDRRIMKVLLVDEYILGLADLIRAQEEFPGLNHIVTASKWNSYTKEVKEIAAGDGVGVFVIDEFMGALHWRDPVKYKKKEKKSPGRKYPR